MAVSKWEGLDHINFVCKERGEHPQQTVQGKEGGNGTSQHLCLSAQGRRDPSRALAGRRRKMYMEDLRVERIQSFSEGRPH